MYMYCNIFITCSYPVKFSAINIKEHLSKRIKVFEYFQRLDKIYLSRLPVIILFSNLINTYSFGKHRIVSLSQLP